MSPASVIAIDGPVAVGKSSAGRLLARRLGYRCLDTGMLYRAITWLVIQRRIGLDDPVAVSHAAEQARLEIEPPLNGEGPPRVWVEGKDVTSELRIPEVERHVSQVSSIPGVRKALLDYQRSLAKAGRVVMVGRDIGTVVLPKADLKIFLIASPEERAKRRYHELQAAGQEAQYDTILRDLLQRDAQDSQREVSPMRPAKDALVIDTDGLGLQQVVNALYDLAVQRK